MRDERYPDCKHSQILFQQTGGRINQSSVVPIPAPAAFAATLCRPVRPASSDKATVPAQPDLRLYSAYGFSQGSPNPRLSS